MFSFASDVYIEPTELIAGDDHDGDHDEHDEAYCDAVPSDAWRRMQ